MSQAILGKILNYCQPFTIIVFVISWIISWLLGFKIKDANLIIKGSINLCFAVANFLIFYGDKIWRK